MKKCPYCAEEIQDEAIFCRYCGRTQPGTTVDVPPPLDPSCQATSPLVATPTTIALSPEEAIKTKNKGCFIAAIGGIIMFVIFYLVFIRGGSGNTSSSSEPDDTDAFVICQQFVEDRLKAPSLYICQYS